MANMFRGIQMVIKLFWCVCGGGGWGGGVENAILALQFQTFNP